MQENAIKVISHVDEDSVIKHTLGRHWPTSPNLKILQLLVVDSFGVGKDLKIVKFFS